MELIVDHQGWGILNWSSGEIHGKEIPKERSLGIIAKSSEDIIPKTNFSFVAKIRIYFDGDMLQIEIPR